MAQQIPDIALEMKEAANALYSKRDFQDAAAKYSAILDQFAQSNLPAFIRTIRCNRAASLIELGRYEDAVRDLQDVIRVKATSPEGHALTPKAHFRLARCLCELRKYAEATKEMETVRDLVGGAPLPDETRLHARIASARGLRQVRYEIKVIQRGDAEDVPDIIKLDMVPPGLCAPRPPEMPEKKFLLDLVGKYDAGMRKNLHQWTCWKCRKRAVGLINTPASNLYQAEALVTDFAQPVCVIGGECDRAAREMIDQELRLLQQFGSR